MLSRISVKYAGWLIKNGANEEDRELYEYGTECILNEIVANILLFSVVIPLSWTVQALVWSAFFMPCRAYFGGYHAKSHLTCIIISTLYALLFVSVHILLPVWLIGLTLMASIIVVVKIVPVSHPNRPMSSNRKIKMKKIAIYCLLIESLIILVLLLVNQFEIAQLASLGILGATSLCLLGQLTNRDADGIDH